MPSKLKLPCTLCYRRDEASAPERVNIPIVDIKVIVLDNNEYPPGTAISHAHHGNNLTLHKRAMKLLTARIPANTVAT